MSGKKKVRENAIVMRNLESTHTSKSEKRSVKRRGRTFAHVKREVGLKLAIALWMDPALEIRPVTKPVRGGVKVGGVVKVNWVVRKVKRWMEELLMMNETEMFPGELGIRDQKTNASWRVLFAPLQVFVTSNWARQKGMLKMKPLTAKT